MAATRARRRLDLLLVERGLASSRHKAQALVLAGEVSVDGVPAGKPGVAVRAEAVLALRARGEHVSRGARKLLGALDAFGVSPSGRVTIDVGASTGGFTEVLLERGAARVYAVDVGRAQLHERLRGDQRVVVMERVNARRLTLDQVGERCSLLVMDVSFISVLKVLPALFGVLGDGGEALVLVKPQFEVGRGQVGRGGLVKDPALHRKALAQVALSCLALGYAVIGACPSPLPGAKGNREFFLHLGVHGPGLEAEEIDAMAGRATGG